ncbi:endonuclease [Actinoalloteichus sp. AHMU CJ021]|uniref:Endonuclease n=1 Tax=Actinoalloteichus caeruleus DSM 43889 TaxID=1120930 RepID=A0ABT1JJZ1_ACTCY|nr:endonuclease [Actinoalloteichus caeruleus]AUS78684.1 endonuclease [Actinoalloteichus sp. AHMU CJ021]MCP2332828.1 hypothetical protein [Actinoalloteichus caeruleus DSM 43889]
MAKGKVRVLLDRAGRTYSDEGGVSLADKPAPLYRLLVLSMLASAPVQSHLAMATSRELVRSGYGTPAKVAAADWQELVDALGRAHYRRYDESTATSLREGAELVRDRYGGDLRRMRDEATRTENGTRVLDRDRLRELLTEFRRIGPTGADIFCREAQLVWPGLRPYFDRKALDGARRVGLPTDPERLASQVDDPEDYARLAAALVRVTLDREVAEDVTA